MKRAVMATASAMTSVALPEMRRYKYEPKLALGSIAAGGTLGVLIPPSTVFIVYAIFAEQSVGRLFMAGFIPGILLATLFTIAIFLRVQRTPSLGPPAPKVGWRERLVASKDITPVLVLALVVLGGIWGGIFTPNEAAGIGAFGAFAFGLGMRQLTMKNFVSALMSTISITAMVFTIVIGAMIYNNFIVVCEVPTALAKFVETLAWPPLGILIAILSVYLILGCIMDAFAMCVLTLPIFIPILANLQLDLIWFGVLFVVMIEMASITPPIGMNVFVVSGMAPDVPMYTVFRGIVPFLMAQIVCQALLITFPQIALFLPNTMIK